MVAVSSGGPSSTKATKKSSSISNNTLLNCRVLLLCFFSGIFCFYVGVLWGMSLSSSVVSGSNNNNNSNSHSEMEEYATQKVRQALENYKRLQSQIKLTDSHYDNEEENYNNKNVGGSSSSSTNSKNMLPIRSISNIASGMARINRDDFASKFDTGVPLDESKDNNNEILMIYQTQQSLPDSYAGHNGEIPLLDVNDGTKNCDFLNIVLTDPNGKRKQCIAIEGQYESFHVQKYMRLPEQIKRPLDSSLPLRYVNRGAQQKGGLSTRPPNKDQTLKYWDTLSTYLQTLNDVLQKLEPVTKQIVNDKNQIVIMVVNYGQAELLLNFACNARSKGLMTDDIPILVFATDVETKDLAEGLGFNVFYDEVNFAKMPKNAAKRYLDQTFTKMMMAKVFVVQMCVMLGYNVLFQDVDVIWYKNPLEYFNSEESGNFDIYFQDDGNHALYYAPYSANTGFYYIKHNDRTQYFFNSFLLAGDLIISTRSHQNALIAVLNEHASLYGLKVKVLSRDKDGFPGGYHYHRRKPFMKDLIAGKVEPYIFHMCWTSSKDNKILFFRQMNEWYLNDKCIDKKASTISAETGKGSLVQTCCSAEPLFSCHYKDKPSFKSCKDSPPIDAHGRSFW